MKTILRIFCITTLTAGIINSADAQRSRESGGNRGSNSSSRSFSQIRSAPIRTFNNNTDRNITAYRGEERNPVRSFSQQNRTAEVPRGNTRVISSSERNIVSRNVNYRTRSTVHNNYHYNNNIYRNGGNYRYSNNYVNVYGRRTVFMYGPRYRVIPSSFVSIHFGGHPYYYNRGYYYGYYAGYYQPIFPPFGLRINVLPFGYTRIFVGVNPFFYYNGIYYRQYDNNNYEVVDAPMDATVSSLPEGARSVIINGESLYELNGTYYKADRDSDGNDVFTVVGKNGVINNIPDAGNDLNTSLPLQIGDTISQLPEGSKVVTINGQQLYETPDNIYLQQQSDDNGVIEYKVIGK